MTFRKLGVTIFLTEPAYGLPRLGTISVLMDSTAKPSQFYLDCLKRNKSDFRAYLGLYKLVWETRPLLAGVYLYKALVNAPNDHLETISDSLGSHLKRLALNPNELFDVESSARTCVAAILDFVRGSPVSAKRIAASLPDNCPPTDRLNTSWDSLCVILLLEVNAKLGNDGGKQAIAENVIKLLVGRALSLDLPITLVAALAFEPTRTGVCKYGSVLEAKEMAEESLEIDHIVGNMEAVRPRLNEPYEVARARLGRRAANDSSRSLPTVIVDAANVAFRAWESIGDSSQSVSCVARWALKGVLNCYEAKGHDVRIVVSEKHLKRGKNKWRQNRVTEIWLDEAIEEIPRSRLVLIPPQNHDDSYMIALALRFGGVIVTNDMFRDWIRTKSDRPLAEKWTRSHLIAFTFVGSLYQANPDFIMPPADDRDSPEWQSLR